MAKKIKLPNISEIWLIINAETGKPVPAIDDPPSAENFLCALTEKDAKIACEYQTDNYGVRTVPMKFEVRK